jgi:hypothetical protein
VTLVRDLPRSSATPRRPPAFGCSHPRVARAGDVVDVGEAFSNVPLNRLLPRQAEGDNEGARHKCSRLLRRVQPPGDWCGPLAAMPSVETIWSVGSSAHQTGARRRNDDAFRRSASYGGGRIPLLCEKGLIAARFSGSPSLPGKPSAPPATNSSSLLDTSATTSRSQDARKASSSFVRASARARLFVTRLAEQGRAPDSAVAPAADPPLHTFRLRVDTDCRTVQTARLDLAAQRVTGSGAGEGFCTRGCAAPDPGRS